VVTFPADVTKAKRAHHIPFGPFARSILEGRKAENELRDEPSAFVFNASRRGRSKKSETGEVQLGERTYIKESKRSVAKVVEDAGIPFSPHDVRRTFATLFEEMGVSTLAVERALNHSSQSTAGKHYVQARLRAVHKQYETLEAKILEEAGVKWPPTEAPKEKASRSASAA
jgi:integrase